jgi:hypothetical protein
VDKKGTDCRRNVGMGRYKMLTIHQLYAEIKPDELEQELAIITREKEGLIANMTHKIQKDKLKEE